MSFPRYSEYKNDAPEWIESIPINWSISPLYAVVNECNQSNLGMIENNLLSLSYGQIVNKDITSNDGLLPESFETYQIVDRNDIVLRLTDLQNDKRSLRSAKVTERGIITSAYLAIRPKGIHPNYLSYLLRSYDLSKVFYSMGGGLRQSMKFIDLKRLPILIPSPTEQKLITHFLDQEISKIDALIAVQEKLIELLKEKRQAVISHAVTKGLDPNVKMKNSGVEWLGQIPNHWSVSKLKFLTSRISSGKTPSGGSEIYIDKGIIFLRSQNVYDDGLRLDEVVHISPEIDEQMSSSRVQPGDILINITGASIGRSCIVPKEFPNANVNQHVCVIRLLSFNLVPFIEIFFKSDAIKSQTEFVQNGAAREGLNFDQIGNMKICLPPADEQTKIVNYVFNKFLAFNRLIAETEKAIELLKERRSALISAAVTGQIDVRNVAITKEAA